MKEFWDERYSSGFYAYGTEPEVFFKLFIDNNLPGKIILPGEGEGRNAVYAAQKGFEVHAFDYSEEGRNKALKLAEEKNVNIDYVVKDVKELLLEDEFYDYAAILFLHLRSDERRIFHEEIAKCLKPGGKLLCVYFAKEQIDRDSGGPQNLDLLYSKEELERDFSSLKINIIEEKQVELNEGDYHQGIADIIHLEAEKL